MKPITCKDCKQPLTFEAPQLSIAENGNFSVIIVMYPPPVVCATCGAVYVGVVDNDPAKTMISTVLRQVAKGEPRILVPGMTDFPASTKPH